MMQTTTKEDVPSVVRFYFFRLERPKLLKDWLTIKTLNKAIADYQRSLGFDTNVYHVLVQVGKFVYNVGLDGTVKQEFPTEDYLTFARTLVCWELDLDEYGVDKSLRLATVNTLDLYVNEDKKLDVKGCLSYLGKLLVGFEPGELPYTCVTLANAVLMRLFDLETVEDSHTPASLLLCVLGLSNSGIGMLYDNGLPPVIEFT